MSVYIQKMQEWFEMDHATASKYLAVGLNRTFAAANARLPASLEMLYLLCNVPTTVIVEQVTPQTTPSPVRLFIFCHPAKIFTEKPGLRRDASGRDARV